MKPGQIIFGVALAVVLVSIASFYALRNWQALRSLRHGGNLPAEDLLYFRRQAYRRLICSALMIALAAMLIGSFALEGPANELVQKGEAAHDRQEQPRLEPDEMKFFDQFRAYWIFFLLLLLAIIVLAGVDFVAIRRYGRRHFRKIQSERRQMIEQELTRLRSQRNGHA